MPNSTNTVLEKSVPNGKTLRRQGKVHFLAALTDQVFSQSNAGLPQRLLPMDDNFILGDRVWVVELSMPTSDFLRMVVAFGASSTPTAYVLGEI